MILRLQKVVKGLTPAGEDEPTMALELQLGQYITKNYVRDLATQGFDVKPIPSMHVVSEAKGKHPLKFLQQYLGNILYTIDTFLNALAFGDGRETISSRVAKDAWGGGKLSRILCWILSRFQKDHCKRALHADLGGRALWNNPLAVVGAWIVVLVLTLTVLPDWVPWTLLGLLVAFLVLTFIQRDDGAPRLSLGQRDK